MIQLEIIVDCILQLYCKMSPAFVMFLLLFFYNHNIIDVKHTVKQYFTWITVCHLVHTPGLNVTCTMHMIFGSTSSRGKWWNIRAVDQGCCMNDKGNRIFEHVTNYGWVFSYQVYNIEKKAQFMFGGTYILEVSKILCN